MHFLSRTKFELTGEFAGFVHTREGKRRMLLRIETTDLLALKLPKELRKKYEPLLQPGARLTVLGIEYRDFVGESKHVVSHLRFLSAAPAMAAADPCVKCPIRVCAKKNCWKNGGKELFERLQARVAELGLQDVITVKATGCLDNCKRGPNVERGKKLYERCDAASIDSMVDRVMQRMNEGA